MLWATGIANVNSIANVPQDEPVAIEIMPPRINTMAGSAAGGIVSPISADIVAAVPRSLMTELRHHANIKITTTKTIDSVPLIKVLNDSLRETFWCFSIRKAEADAAET